MADIFFSLLRIAYLAVIVIFVLSVVFLIRKDVYGKKESNENAKDSYQDTPDTLAGPEILANLSILTGPMGGATYPIIKSDISIGRADTNSLQLIDDYISSKHARIFMDKEKWFIEDYGSTNGTWIEDKRVEGTEELPFYTSFFIGDSEIQLVD
jgi:pSer/pThr/pTyr-binding forkhead associated (FHA) protein